MTKPSPVDHDLSWVPRRNGDVFCSPACGASCKINDYLQANKDGVMLANRLGPEWRVTVYENIGWFYKVEFGAYEVRECRTHYEAQFIAGGHQFLAVGRTAKLAVKAVTEVALKLASAIHKGVLKI